MVKLYPSRPVNHIRNPNAFAVERRSKMQAAPDLRSRFRVDAMTFGLNPANPPAGGDAGQRCDSNSSRRSCLMTLISSLPADELDMRGRLHSKGLASSHIFHAAMWV